MSEPTPTKFADIRRDDSKTEAQIAAATDIDNKLMVASDTGDLWYIDPSGIKYNLSALGCAETDAGDPSVTDDVDAGFEVGYSWVNTADDAVFICVDNTAGAAVWVEVGSDAVTLYATTTTTSATTDSADMLDAAGNYLTVEDETVTAFDFTVICGATTGTTGQASFTGQLVVALDGATRKVDGFVTEASNTTGAGLTLSSPTFDVDTGTGNIEITVEHESTSGSTFEVEWKCLLMEIGISGMNVAS